MVKCVPISKHFRKSKSNTVENSGKLPSSYFVLWLHQIVWIWLKQISLPGTAKMMFNAMVMQSTNPSFGSNFPLSCCFPGFGNVPFAEYATFNFLPICKNTLKQKAHCTLAPYFEFLHSVKKQKVFYMFELTSRRKVSSCDHAKFT